MIWYLVGGCLLILTSCFDIEGHHKKSNTAIDTGVAAPSYDSIQDTLTPPGSVTPQELVSYAETLIGTPYKYASTDPVEGFDCSGFITYVFNHFNIQVPRSSVEFTNAYPEVATTKARE